MIVVTFLYELYEYKTEVHMGPERWYHQLANDFEPTTNAYICICVDKKKLLWPWAIGLIGKW